MASPVQVCLLDINFRACDGSRGPTKFFLALFPLGPDLLGSVTVDEGRMMGKNCAGKAERTSRLSGMMPDESTAKDVELARKVIQCTSL